ncbi:MAG: hypothetical protein JWO41_142 [Candidatus Saccharibacteria bacterium]|nr:hypothetical protein [Candidatus Saccharibacteria bacterium]
MVMRKKLMVVFLSFLAIIFGIILIQLFINHSHNNAAKSVSGQFVSDVLNGDSKDSYALFSSQAQQGTATGDWADTVTTLGNFFAGRNASYASMSSDKASKTKTVLYKIPGNDGNYILKVLLTSQSNTWYVESFSSTRQ